jgi:pancreatic triacylglycerol lipase
MPKVLDAGPRPWYQSMPESQRINRWQAGFVDVIHSDFNPIFSLGLTIPIGDIDFFPNWGTPQPGCMRDKIAQGIMELKDEGLVVGVFQWVRYLLFCSHYRSHEWFFESVWNHKCTFIAVRCPSYEMFMSGECGCDTSPQSCAIMGLDADTVLNRGINKYSEQGKWFIKTSDYVRETGTHCCESIIIFNIIFVSLK